MGQLKTAAAEMGITLSDGQLNQFDRFFIELTGWNQRINLTRITERDDVIRKHFLDSLTVLRAVPNLPARVVDVGTGAGFPGLALKIAHPDIRLTLVESVGKKTVFLHHIIKTLELRNVTVLNARAEKVGRMPAHREKYGLAVARAVAPVRVLAEYLLPLLKPGGVMLAMKGADPTAEVTEARNAFGILGGKHIQTQAAPVPGLDAKRHLVLVRKSKSTPKQYPRKTGTPAKKPI